jgi:hypothetical protein
MNSFVETLLVPIRAGLTFIVRFNLIVAVIGAISAFAWNPEASMDEIVVVVSAPVILYYVAARVIRALQRPSTSTPQPQPSTQLSFPESKLVSPEALLRETRRLLFLIRLMVYSVVLIFLSCAPLLALPLYFWLEIPWAISYGLFMAAAMFIAGVCTFVFALSRLSPSVWQAIIVAARPALAQLLPGSVSAR